jgi:uncharacterized damage-inducible protein DinB
MTRRQLHRLIEAHDEVWLGWWPALTALEASQARRRLGGSWPTVLATTEHMVDSERFWQERLESRRIRNRPASGRRMSRLEHAWMHVRARRLAWIERADLRRKVRFVAADGNPAHVSVAECLIHLTTHAHFHRGQLAMQFRRLGLTPPSRHLLGSFFGEWRRPSESGEVPPAP